MALQEKGPAAHQNLSQSAAKESCSEFTLVWPPCVAVGQPTAVELHLSCAVCMTPAPSEPSSTAAAAAAAAAAHAASATPWALPLPGTRDQVSKVHPGTATVLTVNKLQVVATSSLQLPSRKQGASRLRVAEREFGVLTLVLADISCASTPVDPAAAAPLPVLPALACQEMQELMWSMMCEALPPGSAIPVYDADAFLGTFNLLPSKQQHAMRWAWSTHFCPLSVDLQYCLRHIPKPCTERNPAMRDYFAVMAPLVAFLRDHQCYITLASLLSNCIQQGLAILSPSGNLAPVEPCWSPSAASTSTCSSPFDSPASSQCSPLRIGPCSPASMQAYQPSWLADDLWSSSPFSDWSVPRDAEVAATVPCTPVMCAHAWADMSRPAPPAASYTFLPLSPVRNPSPILPQADTLRPLAATTSGKAWQAWASSFDATQYSMPNERPHTEVNDSIDDMLHLLGDSAATFALNVTWQSQYEAASAMGGASQGEQFMDEFVGYQTKAAPPACTMDKKNAAIAPAKRDPECAIQHYSNSTKGKPNTSRTSVAEPGLSMLACAGPSPSKSMASAQTAPMLLVLLVTLHVVALMCGVY